MTPEPVARVLHHDKALMTRNNASMKYPMGPIRDRVLFTHYRNDARRAGQ